jgi:hypothetical protein
VIALSNEKSRTRANLSVVALLSFGATFAIARLFTSFSPNRVVIINGIHIHHYFYGIILLAIGGWIGITYTEERLDRIAALIYGAGGGLIGDEIGLLLNLNYWTSLTYTFVVVFLTFVITFILFMRYSKTVLTEIEAFTTRGASLYFAVFLAAVSVWMFFRTGNFFISTLSILLIVIACIILVVYVVQRIPLKFGTRSFKESLIINGYSITNLKIQRPTCNNRLRLEYLAFWNV